MEKIGQVMGVLPSLDGHLVQSTAAVAAALETSTRGSQSTLGGLCCTHHTDVQTGQNHLAHTASEWQMQAQAATGLSLESFHWFSQAWVLRVFHSLLVISPNSHL